MIFSNIYKYIMFWNNKYDKLTKLLWIPSLLIENKPYQRNKFKCKHSKISFNYYSDD